MGSALRGEEGNILEFHFTRVRLLVWKNLKILVERYFLAESLMGRADVGLSPSLLLYPERRG